MDPWSKGDYSRHIREALLVVEKLPKINPPSGRVPGRGLLVIPISGSRRRQNREEFCEAGSLFRVSVSRTKYRRKEGQRGGPTPPGSLLVRAGVGLRHLAAWEWWPPSAPLQSSGVFWNANFFYIFLGIFWAL